MLILALKPGHDGTVVAVADGELLFSIEAEKDSHRRFAPLTPETYLTAAEQLGALPDVVALGGWYPKGAPNHGGVGAGYSGVEALIQRTARFFGRPVRWFSSSHERSHILMATGMAPSPAQGPESVLVWEGVIGRFYLLEGGRTQKVVDVMSEPGARYALLYGLADPTFPDRGAVADLDRSGTLMALAGFGDPEDTDPALAATIDRLLTLESVYPAPKWQFRDSPVYNAGVESPALKTAAALLTRRIFETFLHCARANLPEGTPLRISGGCGLNCTWNSLFRSCGHFSSVFVPPCTNDSGSALGTALDALRTLDPGHWPLRWSVYCGLEFEHDLAPDPARWRGADLDLAGLAAALARGHVVAWVQGRWEMGPRALGNRSILAEPFLPDTRARLNEIKQREAFRPVAPCCRIEEAGRLFYDGFEDPYMLYFRRVICDRLGAVTHVDGSARVQTVSAAGHPRLHELLGAFGSRTGAGVLCNTSLNFKGFGFINRMSDLLAFCDSRGMDNIVVGDTWYRRV